MRASNLGAQAAEAIACLKTSAQLSACYVDRTPTRSNRSPPMKSAYELAMERLEKSQPSVSLTDEQKAQIAEIDSSYRAKIAEKELFLKDQIRTARAGGSYDEAESLEKQLAIEIRRLQEDCEEKKEKLRRSFGS
jgi:Spy/CpxP family protein refolding chaperone